MSECDVTGSCVYGEVRYQLAGHIGLFQHCHFSRRRKFTGSAYAANLLVGLDHFKWFSGESLVKRFVPKQTKRFATAFCNNCGSSLPWLTKTEKVIVIPAGTLDQDPDIKPSQNLFCASGADWYVAVEDLPQHDNMPC